MRIELVIDELVLHGFDPRQRHAIGDAVEARLRQLAADHVRELSGHRPMDVERLDAGSFGWPMRAPAGETGAGIATSVFGAVLHEPGGAAKNAEKPT